ncbi:MAG TPA: PKD domain-containing protein, partial [Solirubrobacteraceae bacterium]
SPSEANAEVRIDNSIVEGFEHDLSYVDLDGDSAIAKVVGKNVNHDPATSYEFADGDIDVENGTNLAPGFADAANGDFRLPRESAMVDKGRTGDTYVAFSTGDLLGLPRSRGAKPDLGAYEYQDVAPTAAISGAEARAAGQSLSLSGADSRDGDAGDEITYAWSFGDGTTATGRDVSHAWAAPGSYEVKLVVTDETGKTGQATAKVDVSAATPEFEVDPPKDPGNGGGTGNGGGVTPRDLVAPVIKGLRLKRAKGRLRFRLSETATVRVKIQRRNGRKFRAAKAARRIAGKTGANAVKVATKRLRPGRYRVVVTATDAAGNKSVKRLAFRVV